MKKRWLALLLAALLAIGMTPGALAAEGDTARVVFEAGAPDADGCFTMEMRVYNAVFNVFQFVLWYDADTVVPVDERGAETDSFSAFARREDDGWMATVGTSIDPEQGLIDFTGYVTPGMSVAVDGEGRTGVAVVGESGLKLFTFRFKKVGEAPVELALATKDSGLPYREYMTEGGAVLDAGIAAPLTLEWVYPQEIGESGSTSVTRPGGSSSPQPDKTVDGLLEQAVFLKIGSHAAVVEGGVTAIYPGERAVTAYLRSDRTFIPVRFVAERLGAEVEWESETRTAVIKKDGHTIRMAVGSATYTVDGETRSLDAPAEMVTSAAGYGRTMVPARFITEALGYQVEWEPSRRVVVIIPEAAGWEPDGAVEAQAMDQALSLLAMYESFV